ncbi:helix-turn-helix domain-containing protein [Lonepinella sp. MS14437]|uniref:helix-turn-helix domain-containing protein n=1 Tax=unclassified Lonepinella TaxID=2642006 RepID=UPI0036DF4F87
MTTLTNVQILNDNNGLPAYAVLPFTVFEWLKEKANLTQDINEDSGVPYEVVGLALKQDLSAVRAWREYLGLTQAEMAKRLQISQSAYSQHEKASKLRKTTREKIAQAFGIRAEQLDF